MKKNEFMQALHKQLADIAQDEREDILADYEEHFAIGLKSKRSESDIAKGLGDPKVIAKHIRAERIVKVAHESKKPRHIVRAVFAAAGLGFLNLLFILGPFLAVCGVLIGLFAASVGLTLGGVGAFVVAIVSFFGVFTPLPASLSLGGLFAGIAAVCLGILAVIGLSYTTKYFFLGVIKYLKMNISIITSEDVL